MNVKKNTKYEILTPNGFEDFYGVQKIKKTSISIFFDNGISLRGSLDHKILDIDKNEYFLKDLKINQKIKSPEGFLNIINIKKHYNKTNLYDIIDSGKDNLFISNGIISHNCDFLGSGDNVFREEDIKEQEKNIEVPIEERYFDRNLWIFNKPVLGHAYLLGSDVGSGQANDYSTIVIWDADTLEQVAEYQGKIPADKLGELIYELGIEYNEALAIVDITGGYGQSTVIKLLDMGYPNIHFSEGAGGAIKQRILAYKKKNNEIPGIMIGVNRTNIISTFEIAVRTGIKIKSLRTISEFKTFVFRNGRPDHQNGFHDDLIFAHAIVFYVLQHSFKNLKRYNEQTLAMLNNLMVVETPNSFGYNNNLNFGQGNPLDLAREFSWLFQ